MVIGSAPDIERATNGDERAAAALVAEVVPIIRRRVTRTLIRDRARSGRAIATDVDDLTQEVLLALFADQGRILRAWAPDRGLSFEEFVGLVARRHTLSILRSRRKSPFNTQPVDPNELENLPPESRRRGADRSSETRQSLERLTNALRRRLSPAGVEMFHRLFVEEASVREISRDTGLSADSVYQWRTRIRKAALELRAAIALEA
jgi:RNA polymerase sigma-70 factor (ECF subfamily)